MARHIKKLTKSERLLHEQMLALLEWAAEHPKRWHDIGTLPESVNAAELAREAWRHRDPAADDSIPSKARADVG
jgi:hypothetical protein